MYIHKTQAEINKEKLESDLPTITHDAYTQLTEVFLTLQDYCAYHSCEGCPFKKVCSCLEEARAHLIESLENY